MNGLKPQPVHAEVGDVIQIELCVGGVERTRARPIPQIHERAAFTLRNALGFDGQRVQLIENDVASALGRNDDGMIALAKKVVVVNPAWIARHLVTSGQSVSAARGRVDDVSVLAAADVRHRVSLKVVRVRACHDEIAARLTDAVLHAIAIGIHGRAVAAVHV